MLRLNSSKMEDTYEENNDRRDDNYLSAEGIEKNIDWEALNAEIVYICYKWNFRY
ncbi:MAG: hypothetical protein ACLU3F_13785 [Blautia wexlerae]